MRWRWRKLFVYAVGMLLIALSVFIYVRLMDRYKTEVTMMDTLMPIRLLQPGEAVSGDLLRVVQIPKAAHSESALIKLEEAAGKAALIPIGPNEELVSWKLTDEVIVPKAEERYYSFKTDRLQNNANLVRRGDRVDVWVEFETPKWLKDNAGKRVQVAGVKLIEGLTVAGVKTTEGAEVTDTGGLDQVFGSVRRTISGNAERVGLEQRRAKPSGLPDTNTYIMSEDIYNAYSLGSLGGHIKLAQPDWNRYPDLSAPKQARLTDMYMQLRGTDIFSKEGKEQEVSVERVAVEDIQTKP